MKIMAAVGMAKSVCCAHMRRRRVNARAARGMATWRAAIISSDRHRVHIVMAALSHRVTNDNNA